MNRFNTALIGVFIAVSAVSAVSAASEGTTIAKEQLRSLDTRYAQPEAAAVRPGERVLLEARALDGDRFIVRLPFRPNRLAPLVAAGSAVAAGQAVAEVSGPELDAWLIHARGVEARYATAKKRYRDNLTLFEQQSLPASTWADIANAYFALNAQMHQVEHTRELLSVVSQGQAQLIAPRGGRIEFARAGFSDDGEIDVAFITDERALRLSGFVSQNERRPPVQIAVGDCVMAVGVAEASAQRLLRRIWSVPIPDCLEVSPGVQLEGVLRYPFEGFVVPRTAVGSVNGQPGVFMERDSNLVFVPVLILSSDAKSFYISSDTDITGQRVLIESVSAVQGLLLGLGED